MESSEGVSRFAQSTLSALREESLRAKTVDDGGAAGAQDLGELAGERVVEAGSGCGASLANELTGAGLRGSRSQLGGRLHGKAPIGGDILERRMILPVAEQKHTSAHCKLAGANEAKKRAEGEGHVLGSQVGGKWEGHGGRGVGEGSCVAGKAVVGLVCGAGEPVLGECGNGGESGHEPDQRLCREDAISREEDQSGDGEGGG